MFGLCDLHPASWPQSWLRYATAYITRSCYVCCGHVFAPWTVPTCIKIGSFHLKIGLSWSRTGRRTDERRGWECYADLCLHLPVNWRRHKCAKPTILSRYCCKCHSPQSRLRAVHGARLSAEDYGLWFDHGSFSVVCMQLSRSKPSAPHYTGLLSYPIRDTIQLHNLATQ